MLRRWLDAHPLSDWQIRFIGTSIVTIFVAALVMITIELGMPRERAYFLGVLAMLNLIYAEVWRDEDR